ncbi:MAG TPA: hypothetical protein VGY53_08265, partial [Isosphaeraceae bacterium]|nr:hypothetical protein [Isosphaeraceae bacterium]
MSSLLLAVAVSMLPAARADDSSAIVVSDKTHHLGVAGKPEWEEFAAHPPEGTRLELRFNAKAREHEATLLLRQRDVKLDWEVRLNGRTLGRLPVHDSPLWHAIAVPAGLVAEGPNSLAINPGSGSDDIEVGPIRLELRPLAEALNRASLDVRVRDEDSRSSLPCRITVVDETDALAPLSARPQDRLAARAGVVYTPDGRAKVGLSPGHYRVFATRGLEYGMSTARVSLAAGETREVQLAIRREVPTPGWVACDTHVHTLTFSGHGDATIQERVVTLAGEAIELPIATDHNHFTDLAPVAETMGVRRHFTPVVGDEVTTAIGHFNAFPFASEESVPDARLADWPSLLRSIRSNRPERIVLLNHPRDNHGGFRPFDPARFNEVTGDLEPWDDVELDGVEVINSGALRSDPLEPFRDWFALLNHGRRITAVGSSD